MKIQELYPLLRRQLTQVGLDLDSMPPFITIEQFSKLIDKVNSSYEDYTKRLRTLERSMAASSDDLNSYIKRLKATEEDLKQSDEAKTKFFQNISHELRTPLTLMLHPLDEENQKDPSNYNVSVALKNSRRMLRLVNQLLDLQKVTNNRDSLDLSDFDFKPLLESCCEMALAQVRKKSIKFEVEYTPNAQVIPITGQLDGVEKSVFNYLSNALKFTPVGGTIRVVCDSSQNDFVFLKVIDSGPGIPKEKQGALFQVFSQVNPEDSSTGTGIGLSYVKEIIKKMNGDVGVVSEVGKGSEFWFSLPKGNVAKLNDSKIQAVAKSALDLDNEERSSPTTVASQEVSKAADPRSSNTPRILVVDDLPELRNIVSGILEKEGYEVATASQAESALGMIDQIKPDLIITDWMMPGMSGPDFIRKIRDNENWPKIPVVLLTAKGDEGSRLEGLSAGATAYIGKPFDRLEILTAVRNLLILKKQEKQIAQLNSNLTEKVLKRYLAPELVNQIIKGEFNLDEKVKVEMITVMFCDICGFTSLSEELGPHMISSILNQFFEEMTEVIFKNGGTIDKFMGDGIMTIFGAPEVIPPQEQVYRAKNCALAMQEKIRELNLKWKTLIDQPVMMRVGIHQGPAIVGNFGGPRRTDYTAIGPTVNIASRVESCSKPGEVYFTAIVRDFLPDGCWVKAGRYQLKGIESEVVLFKLHQPAKVMEWPTRKPA